MVVPTTATTTTALGRLTHRLRFELGAITTQSTIRISSLKIACFVSGPVQPCAVGAHAQDRGVVWKPILPPRLNLPQGKKGTKCTGKIKVVIGAPTRTKRQGKNQTMPDDDEASVNQRNVILIVDVFGCTAWRTHAGCAGPHPRTRFHLAFDRCHEGYMQGGASSSKAILFAGKRLAMRLELKLFFHWDGLELEDMAQHLVDSSCFDKLASRLGACYVVKYFDTTSILSGLGFQRWRSDGGSRLLWIKGDPGKGKTMLLCGIIDEPRKSICSTELLSFFFCQATDSHINSATAVLRGME